MWLAGSVLYGALQVLDPAWTVLESLRVGLGMLMAGGLPAAATTFLFAEFQWRRRIPEFFPDGRLEAGRTVRVPIRLRLAATGPLQINDFAGLDIYGSVYQNLVNDIRSDRELPEKLRALVDAGHFGVKTGQGIYEYTEESIKEKTALRDQRFLSLVKLLGS